MPPILDHPDDDGHTGPDGRRPKHPKNPLLRRRAKSKLTVRADSEILGLAGPIRKCSHTTVRFDSVVRAKLLYLASRVYGGTTNSLVIRLLIEAAYAKAVGPNDPSGKVARKAQKVQAQAQAQTPDPPDPKPEASDEAVERFVTGSGISPAALAHLLTFKADLDPETQIPVAMVKAWEPFDHRPWVPGLARIWAWVQAREEKLKGIFASSRSKPQAQPPSTASETEDAK